MSDRPLRVLSLGAGVQSTTLLMMMIAGEIEMADHVVFSDTGWEPVEVYTHLEWCEKIMQEHGMAFHKVTAGNIKTDFLDGSKRFASMPFYIQNENGKKGMVRRQCTGDYKIKPLMKKQRELAGLQPRQRSQKHLITTIIGISYDEVQRMRDPQFNWITHEYPLIDLKMTREDCLAWMARHELPKPPRSACIGCPFKSQNEWRLLKESPIDWADAVDFDHALRENPRISERYRGNAFLHPSMTPLDEVDLRSDSDKGIFSLFDQECEGMCGV